MGGKQKMANRTKNNARPSSSGRSAELLANSVQQFSGFTGLKDTGLLLSGFSLTKPDEIESSIDSSFQLVLKKITKKDSTTKLKGLLEFVELIKTSDQETIKTLLPLWPRYYTVLCTDIDNRVREGGHNVHHQIVLKVKRNIAPFLKQLMAPWFTSQYDSYPPAATVASQAFHDAFPPNKFEEAIVFCQEEILAYIHDNLLVQTAQTLSNPKTVSAEDAEAKYERIIVSCLQGYCLYLEKVSIQNIEKAQDLNIAILANPKFWKLAKSKPAQVRSAWFKVLSVFLQKAVFLLKGKEEQVTSTIFGNLEETDPTVLPYVWESALLTISTIEEWHSFINVDKVYLPKLWKILKQGGSGNASVIHPTLLPLLSRLPPSIVENSGVFYNNFFEYLLMGLKQKTVLSSRSELSAIASSLTECLQYVILSKQDDPVLCKQLIQKYIIGTINWYILGDQTCYTPIFNQIAFVVRYWSSNSQQIEYLHFFYESMSELFKETLFNLKENKDFDLASVSSKQIEFLKALKHNVKPKKRCKVSFDKNSATSDNKSKDSVMESENIYIQRLNLFVYNICEEYVKYIEEKQSKYLFEHLYTLIIDFNTGYFFQHVLDKMKMKEAQATLIDVFNSLLLKWLKNDSLCCKYVVDLIFVLFKFVSDDEEKFILQTLTDVVNNEALGWCISAALSFPYNGNKNVKCWLHTERVSTFLISIAEMEIDDKCPPELNVLFSLAIKENDDGELYIHKEAVINIIDKFIETLENVDKFMLTADSCASIAASISSTIYTENLLLNYNDNLLLALFKLSCEFHVDTDIISTDTLWEVNTAWQDAIGILAKELSKDDILKLTKKAADIIENQFLNNHEALETNNLKQLINPIVNYLRAVRDNYHFQEILNIFINRKFVPDWHASIENNCMKSEYITSHLSSPYSEIISNPFDLKDLDVLKYFAWSYLTLAIYCSISEEYEESCGEVDDDDEPIEEKANSTLILNLIDKSEEKFASLLHDLCLSISFLEHFKNVKYYSDISEYNRLIKTDIKIALNEKLIGSEFNTKLEAFLREKAVNDCWFWCKAIYLLYSEIRPKSLPQIYLELTRDNENQLSIIHLTQIFGPHLSFDHINHKLDTVGSVIILRSLLHCDELDVPIAVVFGKIEVLRNQNVPQFLFENVNLSWEQFEEIREIVLLCSGLINFQCRSLSRRHWDFGILSLVTWTTNCLKARAHFKKTQIQALFTAVANLFICTDNQIEEFQLQEIQTNYVQEWKDLFLESIHADIAQLWLYLAEQMDTAQVQNPLPFLPFWQTFGNVTSKIKHEFIFNFNDDSLPKWTKFLKRSCSLLVNPLPTLQLWGYKMLLVLVPGLVNIDSQAVVNNTPHKKGLIFEQFKEKLVETHEIVNAMLEVFILGEDSCRVKASTDSFTYTFAYLLLWDVLFTLCNTSSTELRYQYADWLRNEDLLVNFLNNLFRLMPTEVLHYSETKGKAEGKASANRFLEKTSLNLNDNSSSDKIEDLVCWLYTSALTQLPALVRQWWTAIETRVAQIVERVTILYVSPYLCAQELGDVMQHQNKFKNMVIKVIPSVREIVATYTVDEAQMDLMITLPANYPLGGPEVQCNRQIAGTTHKQWLLQFKKCVLHQNGRIWDGLSLWNNNLDKKFDGVEECYICFAILHPGTYQLPKLSCQTCKKKFHSACLYKWFSTSNKSSCPICRNLF